MSRKLPAVLRWLFRVRFGNAADYFLGDIEEEYAAGLSRWWVWRQLWSAYVPVVETKKRRREMFSSMWKDVHFAIRTLERSPGFAAIAILSIALGVGINSAIFSLLNAAALRPLPVPGADQLVSVYQDIRGHKVSRSVHGEASMFSTSEYETYRDTNHVFSGVIAYGPTLTATLGGESPRQIMGQYASCNYFDVLGESPRLGRGFAGSDCAGAGTGAVVVLSDDLWRSAFASDPAIIGKPVLLNRQPFTVAGVARPGFRGTEVMYSAFWVPVTIQPRLEADDSRTFANPNMSWLVMLGRTKPAKSLAEVKADLSVIASRIDQSQSGRTTTLSVATANFASMPEARMLVLGVGGVILVAVAMVLLIVCTNLANLLLARGVGRQKEIAIRMSVGASRARLIRQLMTENLIIATLGGALGCAAMFAAFGAVLRGIASRLPKSIPDFSLNVAPDARVLMYSLALTIATAIVFGLVPALRATKIRAGIAGERRNGFLRGGLVGLQVAVSMMLLIAAGLMLRGLYAAQTIDPGFEMKNTLAVTFGLRNQGFDGARAARFQRDLKDRLAALPGVDGVAQARVTPLSDNHVATDVTPSGTSESFLAEVNYVSPEYFSLLGLPITRGRTFRPHEANVVIVTESAARRFWAGEDPIGKTIKDTWDVVFQVIGVAKDEQVSHLGRSNETYVYFPPDEKDAQRSFTLLVHSKVDQQAAIRRVFHDVDPNLAFDVAPLEDNLDWWRTPARIVGILAGGLGALALLLASMGIYGVAAFAVSRRVKEIGIRMALGADGSAVRRIILRQGLRPVLIGAVVGIAGCAGVSQVLKGMLYGVSAYDPVAFVGVPMLLIGIAWLATHVPAQRATKVDPMVALRYE
jgi:predicted permease